MTGKYDFVFLSSVALLLLAGLATLYSIGSTSGEPILYRQLLFLLIGIGAFLLGALFDYRILAAHARYLYIISIASLTAVLLFARSIRGSARWLEIGPFNFQPTELAKIAIIIGLARFFALKRGEIKSVKVILHSALFAVILVVLVLFQPDLGSAFILLSLWFGMFLMTQAKKTHIAAILVALIGLGLVGWHSFLQDYQRERVATFLQPESDPSGSGYNVRQSVIAVGSGQFWGRGLGKGYQSHLRFLPERHTDFIFASFAEELGFVGSFSILLLFGVLLWRILYAAKRSPDATGRYIALGVAMLLILQIFINIGMNMGVMPVTGIPLPLLSYGGSALIATLFLLGVVASIYRRGHIIK